MRSTIRFIAALLIVELPPRKGLRECRVLSSMVSAASSFDVPEFIDRHRPPWGVGTPQGAASALGNSASRGV